MEVTEARPDGFWRWATYVQQGHPVTVTLLSQSNEHPGRKSWVKSTDMTVEQIFSSANQFCTPRKVWDCWLEFDPQFHYPKQMESYQLIIIRVEHFVPCKQTTDHCFTESEVLP